MAYVRPPRLTVERSGQPCQCGCGELTFISPLTRADRGWVAGQPRPFLKGHSGRGVKRPQKHRLRIVKVRGKQPWPRCACGCGELSRGRYEKWAEGHAPSPADRPRVYRPRKAVRWLEDESGCWVWQLGVDVHGYGKISVLGERLKAHRWSFEEHVGPIPEGHDVHHVCENKRCVNPAHLEALSPELHQAIHGDSRRRAI